MSESAVTVPRKVKEPNGIGRVLLCGVILCVLQYFLLDYLTQGRLDGAEATGRLIGNMIIPVVVIGFFNRKRRWSYVTTFLSLLLFSGVLFVADVGRRAKEKETNAQKAEQAMRQLVASFNELAETLEGVKDATSAKEALLKFRQIVGRVKALAEEAKRLPNITGRDLKRLEATYRPKSQAVGERIKKALESSAEHFEDPSEIEKSFEELLAIFQRMATRE